MGWLCLFVCDGDLMDYQTKQRLVRRITCGKCLGIINWYDKDVFVSFVDPKLDLLYEADWLYNNKINQLKSSGNILTLEESYDLLKQNGQWTRENENELIQIKADLSTLNQQLSINRFNKTLLKGIKSTIEKGKFRLKELENKKNQLLPNTIEYLATREKQRFVTKRIVQLDDFSLLEDVSFLDRLAVYYFEESSISDSQIREIARGDPWRLFWTTARDTGTSLFPHSAVEMTELQQSLLSWTKVYDFAFESMNRPSKDIIEDDDRFDSWISSELKRIERENFDKSFGANSGINPNGFGATDIFIVADKEGAKEIYNMNDPMARGRVQQREKIVKEKGEVAEQRLPDINVGIKMEYNQMKATGVK